MSEDPPEEHHDHKPLIFPEGFLWGAATSSHQVEGDNTKNDWWDFELKYQPPDKRSGKACDQYNLYAQDIELAKELNHNSHRLSIEWSRIEPEEGQFDYSQIEHYKKVLKMLKDHGMTVMLTLHHFTNPKWIADIGGWENSKTVDYFNRFIEKVAPEIADCVDLWVTINEPGVLAYMGYISGYWPPQVKSLLRGGVVMWNLSKAHKKAYRTIHKLIPDAKVGIAHNVASFQAFHKNSLRETLAVWGYDVIYNQLFFKLSGIKHHDFLGLNYYFNDYISFNGERSRLPSIVDVSATKKDVSDMGWEIYPEGIFDVIMDFSNYHLPIYITENGLASTNDDRRCRFLISYLKEIYHAISIGAQVKGYFHWSLIDNFEWAEGFRPRFGLVEIDYAVLLKEIEARGENTDALSLTTNSRIPRPSAYLYSEIIENNGLPHKLLRFIGHTVHADEVLSSKHNCHNGVCLPVKIKHNKSHERPVMPEQPITNTL